MQQRRQLRVGERPPSARDGVESLSHHASASRRQPLFVRYADQQEDAYLVHALGTDALLSVPKRRARNEPYPASGAQRPRGTLLLRWSTYALFGVLLGGAPGILLGIAVVCVSMLRLARFTARVRRWRHRASRDRRNRSLDQATRSASLPAIAATERLHLVAALGQGMLAIALGSIVLVLLLERLH